MNIVIRTAIALSIISLLGSCRTSRNLTYFQNLSESTSGTLPMADYSIRIMPADELEIIVTSVIPTATVEFNLPATNASFATGSTSIMASQDQQNYVVNKNGDIDFPVLGKLHVEGMTTIELKDYLTKLISERVEDPKVKVRLINFKVNVMGEVRNPHAIQVWTERFSVFDALAAAGDMNEYGRRDNVIIMREENDSIHYHRLNLRDASVTSSPYYYLRQNDVVIVEPNDVREANAKYNTNNSFRLSVISTIVSAVSVIASLVIALAVK